MEFRAVGAPARAGTDGTVAALPPGMRACLTALLLVAACAPPPGEGPTARPPGAGLAALSVTPRLAPALATLPALTQDAARPALPAAAPHPLALERCDDLPAYADETYGDTITGDLDLRTLPGTAAARDLPRIAADRERAYDAIATFLGLTDRPRITVVLSPNRVAAVAHGKGLGQAFPASDRVEVVYTGAPDSYERTHYGHELAHVLSAHLDGHADHLPLLNEGLAVYLDQSGTNLHRAYADAFAAGAETGPAPAAFDARDVWGQNYARAGSLVAFLVDRFGRERFLDLWRSAWVTWQGWSMHTSVGVTVDDLPSLRRALDALFESAFGEGLDEVLAEWGRALTPYLAATPTALPAADARAVRALFAGADRAVDAADPRAYRATMDGFYCTSWGDAGRMRVARAQVDSTGEQTTTILAARPVGTRNYPEVRVRALRTRGTGRGATTLMVDYWLERFPGGYRITWSTGW